MDTLLVFLLLLLGKRKPTTPSPSLPQLPAPRGKVSFAEAWARRAMQLAQRARSGAAWAPRMAARLGSNAAGAAAARWIGIESGGDPRASSKLGERGLAQVHEKSISELGISKVEFDAMTSARTTDDQHADLAAKVIRGEMRIVDRAGGQGPEWGPKIDSDARAVGLKSLNGIGVGKLRHGLPLLLKELRDQGLLRANIPETLRVAAVAYKPSARAAAFAGGDHAVTGRPAADLLIRFLAPAAVVGFAEAASVFGGAVKEGEV